MNLDKLRVTGTEKDKQAVRKSNDRFFEHKQRVEAAKTQSSKDGQVWVIQK